MTIRSQAPEAIKNYVRNLKCNKALIQEHSSSDRYEKHPQTHSKNLVVKTSFDTHEFQFCEKVEVTTATDFGYKVLHYSEN